MTGFKPFFRSAGLAGITLLLLSGCSSIESFVTGDPAEKEYEAAIELPPLEIPPEMKPGNFAGSEALLIPGGQSVIYSARDGAVGSVKRPQEAISFISQDDTGLTTLRIAGGAATAWNEVRGALAELGVEISHLNRERGIYDVEYPLVGEIERGIVDRLTFWDNDELPLVDVKLVVQNLGEPTTLVRAYDGDEPDSSATASALLESIHRQLSPADASAVTQPLGPAEQFTATDEMTAFNVPLSFDDTRYRLDESGGASRIISAQDFSRTWREVGMAINDESLEIEDRDRSRGLYFVTDIDLEASKGGFFSSMKFWGDDEPVTITRLIAIQPVEGGGNQVLVFDKEEILDGSAGATALLNRLLKHLP